MRACVPATKASTIASRHAAGHLEGWQSLSTPLPLQDSPAAFQTSQRLHMPSTMSTPCLCSMASHSRDIALPPAHTATKAPNPAPHTNSYERCEAVRQPTPRGPVAQHHAVLAGVQRPAGQTQRQVGNGTAQQVPDRLWSRRQAVCVWKGAGDGLWQAAESVTQGNESGGCWSELSYKQIDSAVRRGSSGLGPSGVNWCRARRQQVGGHRGCTPADAPAGAGCPRSCAPGAMRHATPAAAAHEKPTSCWAGIGLRRPWRGGRLGRGQCQAKARQRWHDGPRTSSL